MKKHPDVGGNAASLIPNKTNYSKNDLSALSKLAPQGNSMPSNLVLCDLCGQPIAGSSISKPEEFAREMSAGRHFACHMKFVSQQEETATAMAKAKVNLPKWADENLSEEEKAKAFNADESDMVTINPDAPTQSSTDNQPTPKFIPAPGSLPLKKILDEGGLSAKDPKDIPLAGDVPDDRDVKNVMEEFKRAQAQAEEEYKKQFESGDPGLVQPPQEEEQPTPEQALPGPDKKPPKPPKE